MDREPDHTTHRVLILFAHPALQKSRFNKAMVEKVKGLPGVFLHDLYEAYPEFDIDIDYEQQLIEENDIIVMQYPLLWYSSPALIKEWLDMVLEHGWAYGSEGTALHGKKFIMAITTGAPESVYAKDGWNRHTIQETLTPFAMTARLCGMEYLPPFAIHGAHALKQNDIEPLAEEYKRTIIALRDGRLSILKKPILMRGLTAIFPL